MNCYEYSARNLECNRPYAPAADEVFRTQWLHYRQIQQVFVRRDVQIVVLDASAPHTDRCSWLLIMGC